MRIRGHPYTPAGAEPLHPGEIWTELMIQDTSRLREKTPLLVVASESPSVAILWWGSPNPSRLLRGASQRRFSAAR